MLALVTLYWCDDDIGQGVAAISKTVDDCTDVPAMRDTVDGCTGVNAISAL